jgi:hypothetical protein
MLKNLHRNYFALKEKDTIFAPLYAIAVKEE